MSSLTSHPEYFDKIAQKHREMIDGQEYTWVIHKLLNQQSDFIVVFYANEKSKAKFPIAEMPKNGCWQVMTLE